VGGSAGISVNFLLGRAMRQIDRFILRWLQRQKRKRVLAEWKKRMAKFGLNPKSVFFVVLMLVGLVSVPKLASADCLVGDDYGNNYPAGTSYCATPTTGQTLYFHLRHSNYMSTSYYAGRYTWKAQAGLGCSDSWAGFMAGTVQGDPKTLEGARVVLGFRPDRDYCINNLKIKDNATGVEELVSSFWLSDQQYYYPPNGLVYAGHLGADASGLLQGDETRLSFSIQYKNVNDYWMPFYCSSGNFSADFFWTEGGVLTGYSDVALDCTNDMFSYILQHDTTPVSISIKVNDFDGNPTPFVSETIDNYSIDYGDQTLNIPDRPDNQPTDSIRLYGIDYGWSTIDGVPTGTPSFNPEGGTNPYYYNFDGLECNYAILTAKQINEINADTNYLDWEHPDFLNEYTVYPVDPTSSEFGGTINMRIFPYVEPERPYFNVSGSCYTDDGRIRREGIGGNLNYLVGGEAVYSGTITDPCASMELTNPESWIKCLTYRFQTTIITPLFVPDYDIGSKYQALYDELQDKFPFVYVSGGVAQLNTIVDYFDVGQGSPPVLHIQAPLGIDWTFDTSQYSDYTDLIYAGFQLMLLIAGVFFVLRTAGFVNHGGDDE